MSDPRWTDEAFRAAMIRVYEESPLGLPMAQHVTDLVLRALADAGLLVEPGSETRTWSLPAEPGPEVTAVRDRGGDKWIRATIDPFHEGWYLNDFEGAPHGWYVVLSFGPLTDATAEAINGEQP